MVDDFHDGCKRNLNDLAIRPFNFERRCRKGLSRLHAAHNAPDAMTVAGNNFDIALAIQWLQGYESFCDFHKPQSKQDFPDYTWSGSHS